MRLAMARHENEFATRQDRYQNTVFVEAAGEC
jgi:hypothetical protein